MLYELREIYSLSWGVDVDASRLACAPFGGPVAVVRDDRKILRNTAGLRSGAVQIFSAAGAALGKFVWDRPSRLVAFSWTDEEVRTEVHPGTGPLRALTLHATHCFAGSSLRRGRRRHLPIFCGRGATVLADVPGRGVCFARRVRRTPLAQRPGCPHTGGATLHGASCCSHTTSTCRRD